MSLWDYKKAPKFDSHKQNGDNVVAKSNGWYDDDTGEKLVAIRGLTTKAGPADVRNISFNKVSYVQGEALSLQVDFTEAVDVTAGASIVVSSTGATSTITLYADAQAGVYSVIFNLQADLLTPEVTPAETATLSVAAQTISGTVVDAGTATASNLVVGATIAAAAGTPAVA